MNRPVSRWWKLTTFPTGGLQGGRKGRAQAGVASVDSRCLLPFHARGVVTHEIASDRDV